MAQEKIPVDSGNPTAIEFLNINDCNDTIDGIKYVASDIVLLIESGEHRRDANRLLVLQELLNIYNYLRPEKWDS